MRPRLHTWLRRRRLDRDLEKELRFHLDEHARHLIAQGVPPQEAHRRARLELGGVEQVAERVRDGRPDAAIDHLVQDLRDAVRSLARTPGLTAAVVALILLQVGIGVWQHFGSTRYFAWAPNDYLMTYDLQVTVNGASLSRDEISRRYRLSLTPLVKSAARHCLVVDDRLLPKIETHVPGAMPPLRLAALTTPF